MTSAVFVDASTRKRFEIARDARDPLGDAQPALESLCDVYSGTHPDKKVQLFAIGTYLKPWRQQTDPVYESRGGQPTPDYRPI